MIARFLNRQQDDCWKKSREPVDVEKDLHFWSWTTWNLFCRRFYSNFYRLESRCVLKTSLFDYFLRFHVWNVGGWHERTMFHSLSMSFIYLFELDSDQTILGHIEVGVRHHIIGILKQHNTPLGQFSNKIFVFSGVFSSNILGSIWSWSTFWSSCIMFTQEREGKTRSKWKPILQKEEIDPPPWKRTAWKRGHANRNWESLPTIILLWLSQLLRDLTCIKR